MNHHQFQSVHTLPYKTLYKPCNHITWGSTSITDAKFPKSILSKKNDVTRSAPNEAELAKLLIFWAFWIVVSRLPVVNFTYHVVNTLEYIFNFRVVNFTSYPICRFFTVTFIPSMGTICTKLSYTFVQRNRQHPGPYIYECGNGCAQRRPWSL